MPPPAIARQASAVGATVTRPQSASPKSARPRPSRRARAPGARFNDASSKRARQGGDWRAQRGAGEGRRLAEARRPALQGVAPGRCEMRQRLRCIKTLARATIFIQRKRWGASAFGLGAQRARAETARQRPASRWAAPGEGRPGARDEGQREHGRGAEERMGKKTGEGKEAEK